MHYLYDSPIHSSVKQVETLFENDAFIALNKPAGMLSIPDREQSQPSLKDLLQQQYSAIYTVHRLDRDTSGLIIFAKTPEAHKHLSALFENRQTTKKYLGVVQGCFPEISGLLDSPIREHSQQPGKMIQHPKGKPSITEFRVLEKFPRFALVEFTLITGRTHQIRVHASGAGHPIACDPVYGSEVPVYLSALKHHFNLGKYSDQERPLLNRLALHSHELGFTDRDGTRHQLSALLPRDMSAFLNQLRKLEKKS